MFVLNIYFLFHYYICKHVSCIILTVVPFHPTI